MDAPSPLPAGILTPELAAALGGHGLALRPQELTHNAGNQATGGIWRVAGPAGSAVLKLATAAGGGHPAWATSDQGHHWNYWRREVLAYQSGFAARVYADAGLVAPRLLGVVEPRAGGGGAVAGGRIAVTGAAKYCWLAPLMLQRLAAGGRPGFYDRRDHAQVLRGRLGMLRLVAAWGDLALGEGAG